MVWAKELFRTYLLGNRFDLLTDHKAIISALKDYKENKPYRSRLTRWVDQLLPFDYDIRQVPGAALGMADYLSRNSTFEAPPISVYDDLFVIKPLKNPRKYAITYEPTPRCLPVPLKRRKSQEFALEKILGLIAEIMTNLLSQSVHEGGIADPRRKYHRQISSNQIRLQPAVRCR